ncbi:MAG: Rieske (2Fe-2S) protein [Actinomycetota bacterium]
MEAREWILVGTLGELRVAGVKVVPGADRPIAVFSHEGRVAAVDNRCPHMGFPLHRGSVQNGILTCHWHHARFDLGSGCTFDLFADDVPGFDVEVRGEEVFVASLPRARNPVEQGVRRLREGMEQNLGLIQAKSVLALLKAQQPPAEVVKQAALYGLRFRDGWGSGVTILTAMANLVPHLDEETAYFALPQGVRRTAADTAGMTPRRDRHPLDAAGHEHAVLLGWLRNWTLVRHRDGAERTVLTAIQNGATQAELVELLLTAATERPYADTGHQVDFCNKAFELLDLIGWEHAAAVLPTLIGGIVSARGVEEQSAWRHPIDLIPLLREAEAGLPTALCQPRRVDWGDDGALVQTLLGDDPASAIAALSDAFTAGAAPAEVARLVTYAAALRVARFGPSNEIGDWITALHTFTHCNALHQAIRRCATSGVVRGVFAAAMSVYLDRFLNVPPAPLPGERGSLDSLPQDAAELLTAFLEALDQKADPEAPARLVARYLALGHAVEPLFNALTLALVREDADFHTFQMVEASIRQWHEWRDSPRASHFLIACARYLAAHSPTQRAQHQTARIALRLHRGDPVFEDEA